MLNKGKYSEVRELLLSYAQPVTTEVVSLGEAFGRILAEPLVAKEDVPPFDRSCFDGYTFRCEDVAQATPENPVTLTLIETIPAGTSPTIPVTPGTAAKILTGAPIPEGANAVLAFEKTKFTDSTVTLFQSMYNGQNIVRRGEDILAGAVLAQNGEVMDASLCGSIAGQGKANVRVYRRPIIGLLSTGSELIEPGKPLEPGKIYNSNHFMLAAAIKAIGCDVRFLDSAEDSKQEIARLLREGLDTCDAVVSTGGVSVGDYDLTPDAMESIGATMLARGICMKPGAASAFSLCEGKLIFGLSGNPASSMTAFYSVVQPVLKKMCGIRSYLPEKIDLTLLQDFPKASQKDRLLRGRLVLKNGIVGILPAAGQGNVILSSSIGNNVIAVIPGGSQPVPAGTKLKGFLI